MHRFTGSGVLDVDACRCIFTVDLDADAETLWINQEPLNHPKPISHCFRYKGNNPDV
jgi:hypothetical protein